MIPCCDAWLSGKAPTFLSIPNGSATPEEYCRGCAESLLDPYVIEDCWDAYGWFPVRDTWFTYAKRIHAEAVAALGPDLRGYSITDLLLDQIDSINTQTAVALAEMIQQEVK